MNQSCNKAPLWTIPVIGIATIIGITIIIMILLNSKPQQLPTLPNNNVNVNINVDGRSYRGQSDGCNCDVCSESACQK